MIAKMDVMMTLTSNMRTPRIIPAAVTKKPPENTSSSPNFLSRLNEAVRIIGMGMAIRYASVMTLRTREVRILVRDVAG